MWWKILIGTVGVVLLALAGAGLAGRRSWRVETERLRDILIESRAGDEPAINEGDAVELPQPVRRYLDAVLPDRAEPVLRASIEHSGTFNMGEGNENWQPFTSVQDVVVSRPGFIWDARVRLAPALTAFVRDAYVAGEAHLTAKLAGLVTVMNQESSPELAQGELMRFLAEAAWYPTAFLSHEGLSWEPVDDSSSRVTLKDGTVTVSVIVTFGEDGLIASVYSDGRYRDVDGEQVATPWEGRFWNYQERGGMLIPLDGEVAWLLPDGPHPYWRGHIEQIEFEFAR